MLKQPVGFVKLTNVALVRYKAKGRRFEIACYPSKVVDWRNGQEKSLAEVLQSEEIFSNVEQGELAKAADLRSCFGELDREQITRLILDKGELQVSQRERDALAENVYNEVLTMLGQKLVYSATKRPVPLEQVKAALRAINFQPNINRPARQQASESLRQVEQQFNVERAAFLVRVPGPATLVDELRCLASFEVVQTSEEGTLCTVSTRVFPQLEELAREREVAIRVVDEAYCNKHPRSLDEAEVFLQRKELSSDTQMPETEHQEKAPAPRLEGLSCATCGGAAFSDKTQYRLHIQSDWHKYNLQAKLKDQGFATSEKYEEIRLMIEMAGEAPPRSKKKR